MIEDTGTETLGLRTVRGGGVVLASKALRRAASLGLTVVLARLLMPRDFGLLGMVVAFDAFLQMFLDLGLSEATVQKLDLTHRQASTLFWLNLTFGFFIAAVAAAASPVIATFYGEPRLLHVALWYSLGFPIAGLGVQHTALLRRRMHFGRIALREFTALLVSGTLAIWMALRGFGVYALVARQLAWVSVSSVLAWLLTRWVPSLPRRGTGVRGMVRFGGYLAGSHVLNYFARNADKLFLGRFWGAAAVGLYTRAYALMTEPIRMVSAPMGAVMIPALSKLQAEKDRYARAHLRAMRLLALVSFPVAGGLAVASEEVILTLYGPRWAEAVPVFRVLCLAGILQGWSSSTGWLFITAGKTRQMFRWAAVACPTIALSALPAVWHGPVGAALGYAIVILVVAAPVGTWYAAKCAAVPLRPLVKAGVGPLLATAVMAGAVAAARAAMPEGSSAPFRLVGLLVIGAASYAVSARMTAATATRELWRSIRVFAGRAPETVSVSRHEPAIGGHHGNWSRRTSLDAESVQVPRSPISSDSLG